MSRIRKRHDDHSGFAYGAKLVIPSLVIDTYSPYVPKHHVRASPEPQRAYPMSTLIRRTG